MNGPRDYSKWSKSERQIPYDITYMWNLKYDTKELIYETGTESQTSRLVVAGGRQVREGGIGSLELADTNYYTLDK